MTSTSTSSDPDDQQRLDATFAALANSTRRAILQRLARGEASVNELARPFDLSLPAVSRHLRVLQEAGLVRQGRRAQYRPCSLEPEPLAEVASWAEQYRHIWQARFDQMEDYLAVLSSDQRGGPGPDPHVETDTKHQSRADVRKGHDNG